MVNYLMVVLGLLLASCPLAGRGLFQGGVMYLSGEVVREWADNNELELGVVFGGWSGNIKLPTWSVAK